MIDFLTIILLVFGVLQIILFFKIWGMTNDVKRLTNKFCNNDNNLSNTNDLIETPCDGIPDNIPDGGVEISVGDKVIRRKDGKEMIVDRIICGKYGCADPNTRIFIAGYTRDEIRKADTIPPNDIYKDSSKTTIQTNI